MQLDCTAALMHTRLDLSVGVEALPAYRLQHVISCFRQLCVFLSRRPSWVSQEVHLILLGGVLFSLFCSPRVRYVQS